MITPNTNLQTNSPTLAMAVVGAGTMGVGIAYVYAVAGWNVTIVEPDDARTSAVQKTLAEVALGGAKRGKLSPAQVQYVYCILRYQYFIILCFRIEIKDEYLNGF